jgi:hypothetical protein
MEKVKITLVVPERIAALVQNYVQCNLLGDRKDDFLHYLERGRVKNPEQYLPEMEIGIEHPDDEPVKIMSYLAESHKDVLEYLQEYIEPTYSDNKLDEHLYSIDCLSEGVFWPPIKIVEFHESVKATGCSYFRFIK